jgi:hypothetical protein
MISSAAPRFSGIYLANVPKDVDMTAQLAQLENAQSEEDLLALVQGWETQGQDKFAKALEEKGFHPKEVTLQSLADGQTFVVANDDNGAHATPFVTIDEKINQLVAKGTPLKDGRIRNPGRDFVIFLASMKSQILEAMVANMPRDDRHAVSL